MLANRRALRLALSGVLALLFTVVSASPAQAWTWQRNVTVYNGPTLCVQGNAGIDHFIPGVFSGNLAYANVFGRSAGCGAGLTGWSAAVRLEVQKWNGSGWTICRSTDWTYGTTGADQWGPTGPSQVYDYGGSASCGPGYYGTLAYAYVHDGFTWQGGAVWSGYEYVP